ncbi:hypothetical protein GUT189_05030 [Streptococcus ruminantium]|nr:hypothetical protein GUT189_05030 [Streptococcus ruminantium]
MTWIEFDSLKLMPLKKTTQIYKNSYKKSLGNSVSEPSSRIPLNTPSHYSQSRPDLTSYHASFF